MRPFRKLAWLLQRSRKEAELSQELQFHLEEEAEERHERGASQQEAKWAARRDLGNLGIAEEDTRAVWSCTVLEGLAQDLRYALRGLKNNPGFALTAILSLSLGLGTSLAIYTAADNLLLRPLPYPNSSRLVMLWEEHLQDNQGPRLVAPRNYFALKARNEVFQDLAVFDTSHAVLGDSGRSEEFAELEASSNLLSMLSVQPILGRRFTDAESQQGSETAMLISFRLWQSWFGGDRNILGRRVSFGGRPRTIIGVLPANFYFYDREIDIWSPLVISPARNNGDGRWLKCLARLRSGVTLKQVRAATSAISRQRATDDPEFNKGWLVSLEPLHDALVRNVKPSLIILLGSVGLLLAVACANVANLLLARYTARHREMALRTSLGAGRLRIVRQLLTESVLLAAMGGASGMLLARWMVTLLVFLAPKDLSHSIEVAVDLRIYLFAAGLTALTSILFGLAPALAGSRTKSAQTMQIDGRSSIGGKARLRAWFVGAEIALSVVLLSGALLLFRSLEALQNVNPGIDAANLLTLRVSLPGARYAQPSQTIHFFARAVQQIDSLPGVRSASAVSHLPFNGLVPATNVQIAGRPPRKPGDDRIATVRTVLPGYFQTMGIPLLSGRDFTATDDAEDTPHRFIVSQAFVRKYLGNSNPIDQQISVWMEEKNPFGRIIGVVGDVRDERLDQSPTPTVYYPHAHLAYNRMILVVRSGSNPLALAEPIRRAIRRLDPAQPVADVRTMGEVIAGTFSRQRFSTLLLIGFSVASLLLAAVGVFGILTYSVSERTREIGVRVAVGATPYGIISLVMTAAATPVFAGLVAGMAGAFALTGLLRSVLFDVSPRDPLTFAVVPLILALVASFAAYLPARRASRLDPMVSLRTE
jgi:putative ABC transport system permease protein